MVSLLDHRSMFDEDFDYYLIVCLNKYSSPTRSFVRLLYYFIIHPSRGKTAHFPPL